MCKAAVASIDWRSTVADRHDLVDLGAHGVRSSECLVHRLLADPAVGFFGKHAAPDLIATMTIRSTRVDLTLAGQAGARS